MFLNLSTFPLGPFVISVGGIMLLIGILLSSLLLLKTTRRKNLSISFLSDNLFYLLLIPALAGRIGAFLHLMPSFIERIKNEFFFDKIILFVKYFFSIWEGGFDYIWLITGFMATLIGLAIIKKEDVWKWLDAFVLPGVLLIIFIHVGGFFSSWGYGKPVNEDFLFAISYDLPTVRFAGPLHPVQVYGVIAFSILFSYGLKFWYRSLMTNFRWNNGTYFLFMTMFASLINAFLEFFRGDAARIVFSGMRLPQLLSFALALAALIALVIHTHEKKAQKNNFIPPK